MTTPPAPRLVLAVPFAFLAHVAEELTQGFPGWASAHFGRVTTVPFFLVSHVPLVLGAFAVALHALRGGRHGAFLVFGAQVVLVTNGLFHATTTLLFNEYSPGVVTGTALYVPVTVLLARRLVGDGHLSRASAARATALGCLLSAGIIASLFFDRVLF